MKLRMPLRYQIRGESGYHNTVSDDISISGIGFIDNEFLAPNTYAMLEFNVLSRVLRPIGRVVRANPLPHSDRYRLGLEFIECSKGEKNYLGDFINMKRGTL